MVRAEDCATTAQIPTDSGPELTERALSVLHVPGVSPGELDGGIINVSIVPVKASLCLHWREHSCFYPTLLVVKWS
jgi:hypothetical protein